MKRNTAARPPKSGRAVKEGMGRCFILKKGERLAGDKTGRYSKKPSRPERKEDG